MSNDKSSFYVYGAPVSFLVECYRYRMNQRLLILSLPKGHTAEVIKLAEWKASRALPN
jgi:hypothetical protein